MLKYNILHIKHKKIIVMTRQISYAYKFDYEILKNETKLLEFQEQ